MSYRLNMVNHYHMMHMDSEVKYGSYRMYFKRHLAAAFWYPVSHGTLHSAVRSHKSRNIQKRVPRFAHSDKPWLIIHYDHCYKWIMIAECYSYHWSQLSFFITTDLNHDLAECYWLSTSCTMFPHPRIVMDKRVSKSKPGPGLCLTMTHVPCRKKNIVVKLSSKNGWMTMINGWW